MQQVLEFYTGEKHRFEKELQQLKKRLATSSMLRLLVFLSICAGFYFFFGNAQAMLLVGLLGFSLFLFLVSRHSNLTYKRNLIKELIEINSIEINVLHNNYLDLDDGADYIDSNHSYSYDIDLFGRGSFFQYANRTSIKEGRIKFFKILTENSTKDIELKQRAIQELAIKPMWRQQFSAIARLVKVQHSAKAIHSWIHNYKSVFPKHTGSLSTLFSIFSLILIVLASFQIIPFSIVVLWFFIGLGITGIYLKKIAVIYNEANKAKDTFKQYYQLLNLIENASFDSKILQQKQNDIKVESKKASAIFASFSRILDALDQRNNLIIALLGNGFFLRDTHQSYKVEQWIKTYGTQVENWFEAVAFFDAQNTLGNFAFNHPSFTYAKILKGKNSIKAEQLGHPLLKRSQRVDNDFLIKNQQFFIITGANMAGKSTFLRTVSLSIIMSNIGLPVCAKSFEYTPIKLVTSMRTSDSLTDDSSYFFSELKRLKFIVDEIKNNDYFIILDEILKGTNSTDKAIGSKKFVQKLVASKSTGIIATHDLSLCEIEKEVQEVHNYFFDAEIISDDLHFDYQLKNGVCKNMNASFLLKKMEIVS